MIELIALALGSMVSLNELRMVQMVGLLAYWLSSVSSMFFIILSLCHLWTEPEIHQCQNPGSWLCNCAI
ncbi:hypothetical protein XBI1_2280015 [Xenorhabdus bovienii str. Intermedium]|uniref:Uncharacterized protein n=1 Tax=Xenorhabdus bovienii str. Intermedium TaxID=1379677 RepID=A0A077QKE6_XENBV|nr:hypothetical protein XBI1_2280015 [Xenorhabdus bovienii str. Intermedium]